MELLSALFGSDVLLPGEGNSRTCQWQTIGRSAGGSMRLLDARRPASLPMLREELGVESADLFVFVCTAGSLPDALADDLHHALQVLAASSPGIGVPSKLLGLLLPVGVDDVEISRRKLDAAH